MYEDNLVNESDDGVKELSPFSLNKKQRSPITPPSGGGSAIPDPTKARELAPIIFTKPGEDHYTSDDPEARPVYSDFRAMILPADSDVPIPGEDTLEDDLEEEVVPKDLSAPASAPSSPPLPETLVVPPAPTVPLADAIQTAADSLDAVKDNGPPKENESSTPTSSSTPSLKPGKSEPPASA